MQMGDVAGAGKMLLAVNKSYNPKSGKTEFNPVLAKRRQKEFMTLAATDPSSGGLGDFMKSSLKEVGDIASKKFNSAKNALANVDFSFSKQSSSELAQSGMDAILAGHRTNLAELGPICDTLMSMSGGMDDSEFLHTLRQEGANLYG
jgi:hypothetical protein